MSSAQQLRGEAHGRADPALPLLAIPEPRAALLRRFGELFGDASRFSHRRWGERLDRVLARLDRYADFGRGRDGAGLDYALGLMQAHAEEVKWSSRRQGPASLAYYVPLLEEVSKDWRRHQAARTQTPPDGWRASWANPKKKPARGQGFRAPAGRSTTGG